MHSPKLERLVEALRSGEFDQTKHQLRTSEGFCCLGVACELYRRETGIGYWEESYTNKVPKPITVYKYVYPDYDNKGINLLPKPIADWYDITAAGRFSDSNHLALLNDLGKTFAEIADTIVVEEANLFTFS